MHRALFQDRNALLHLPFDELEATIEQRIEVWKAVQARGGDEASPDEGEAERAPAERVEAADRTSASETVESGADAPVDAGPDGAAGDVVRGWRVTIDLTADRAKADQLFTRVRDRWKADKAVGGIDLTPTG